VMESTAERYGLIGGPLHTLNNVRCGGFDYVTITYIY